MTIGNARYAPKAQKLPTRQQPAQQKRQIIASKKRHPFKTWRIMHTDYRRPIDTFDTTISAVVGLHFYRMA